MADRSWTAQYGVRFPWWDSLCECITETFRFTEAEQAAFRENRTAQLIGAIPFVAGCEDAERTALAHLCIYVTELRGGSSIGGHHPTDNTSLFTRLRLISAFVGGNRDIINHGMNRLALIMLIGYERSQAADMRNQVYNPLNDGSWDGPAMKRGLEEAIQAFPCAALDSIFDDGNGTEPYIW